MIQSVITRLRKKILRYSVEFEPRDCWIGFFWDKVKRTVHVAGLRKQDELDLRICIIPFFPITLVIHLATYPHNERRPSKITPEEVDEALERGAEGVKYLRKTLDRVFTLGSRERNLVLD
jgi:hypothetical protein